MTDDVLEKASWSVKAFEPFSILHELWYIRMVWSDDFLVHEGWLNESIFLVCRYRAVNAGKFPKAHDTMKQVGGNYYVVKKIIQELEYISKMNASNRMVENLVGKELLNEEKPLTTDTVKVSPAKTEATIDMPVQNDCHLVDLEDKDVVNADYEHLQEERGPQTSSWGSSMSQEAIITTSLVSIKNNYHCEVSLNWMQL